ncbi:hypothetical protein LTR47_004204 [Exophiala xenobiotica]|nr:hypothetical protein LTR41_005845 [Exophiala xenobiotica]KAK5234759.1 hypothetical protein LTR47_004204 [Exophiala xenobiotica]KAK5251750.1 hypothetical protein LTS06_003693 [Exophiala xenobiotica]KAK5318970.1 hypothetical protein LTR93_007664 [Exophiala xenobiotica]KAK5349404.1 hypothetical protein LTR61_006793 [Exophiala xenobiotica]
MVEPTTPRPYTANPLLLIISDLGLFASITFTKSWSAGLPSIVLPIWPTNDLDELAVTPGNLWAIFLHVVLIIGQSLFLLSLVPLAFVLLPSLYFPYIIAFVAGNQAVSVLLNGWRQHTLVSSDPECVEGWATHPNEKWVFINGVAVGSQWLQSNLNRLAMTFRRPVYGIHNQTRGIIFDVLECIIQRDLSYATLDIRQAYSALTNILSDDDVHKVVLILHSQGAIEGGMVLDWLYATVSAKDIRKLEIYTFGNAANHWNGPANGSGSKGLPSTASSSSNGVLPHNQSQRLVKYIEHYANTGDYVSRFGILHFRPDQARPNSAASGTNIFRETARWRGPKSLKSQAGTTPVFRERTASANIDPKTEDENRFVGQLFKREGSGHQLNQHYLDNIFEMENVDTEVLNEGRVRDGNAYMDSQMDEAVMNQWNTVQAIDSSVDRSGNGGAAGSGTGRQIKQVSRLWSYRNGGDPDQHVQTTK